VTTGVDADFARASAVTLAAPVDGDRLH